MNNNYYQVKDADGKVVGETTVFLDAKQYIATHTGCTYETLQLNGKTIENTLPKLQETTPPPKGERLVQ